MCNQVTQLENLIGFTIQCLMQRDTNVKINCKINKIIAACVTNAAAFEILLPI